MHTVDIMHNSASYTQYQQSTQLNESTFCRYYLQSKVFFARLEGRLINSRLELLEP